MSRPVHVSIRDDLRMRLVGGEWPAGKRLPSETDLAAQYGVARMTVRQAVGVLASEGSNRIVEFAMSTTRPGYPVETIMERRPASEAQEQPAGLTWAGF
jgi:DNA-binding FadR family transcriptional regulator